MKNTLENKARFFAQYWGQNVLRFLSTHNTVIPAGEVNVNSFLLDHITDNWLELKPLSLITNEDAIEVAKIVGYKVGKTDEAFVKVGKHVVTNMLNEGIMEPTKAFKLIDFLRSKGYALPWMGVSVEQQIEFGWIKLK